MKLKDLYQIKVESYRDFRNHLLSCFNAYIVAVGLLGYFAFEAHAKNNLEQFRMLWVLLIGLLSFALFLSYYYLRHAHRTAQHVEKLSKLLTLSDKPELTVEEFCEDGDGMRAAMWTFAGLNIVAWLFAWGILLLYARF